MARSLWKGAISFGLVNVPVELHSAKKRSAELDMTMLDKRDLAPVGYQRVNKSTGKEVTWGDVVKGYEYKDDKFVVLSDEDFRRANPEASRTVDILAFVELADIQPQFFETPYYLVPEKRGGKAYALLRETLEKAGKAGIASVVIRTRQLRLVEDMADEWRPGKYQDTYREDLLKRVKEKIKAGESEEITGPEQEPHAKQSAEVIDLMSLLKQSVAKKPKRGAA